MFRIVICIFLEMGVQEKKRQEANLKATIAIIIILETR